jgi:GDP-L-fucose synthase
MPGRKIWVAGHNRMVGSAITRLLRTRGRSASDGKPERSRPSRSRRGRRNKPDVIIFAPAKVGGIIANGSLPADFIYDNLALQTNVIHGAHCAGIDRLVFLRVFG